MKIMKKRANGKGSVIFLGQGRNKPWGARISLGKDLEGRYIYYFLDTFEQEIDALVCLENYHKNPTSIYIKEEKFNRIVTFPKQPYPIIPVKNPHQQIINEMKKDNFTFKQVYEEYKELKFPTVAEGRYEKNYHKRAKGKLSYNYSRGLVTAFNQCEILHDKVYKELKTSDFQKFLNDQKKGYSTLKQFINLFKHLDSYALQEDIIDKGYSQFLKVPVPNEPKIIKKPFTYAQIDYLWNIKTNDYREEFIRDILLIALYTGARADEILSIKTENIFLEQNFFVGGLKTKAGINREIPIHRKIKPIIEKYYNTEHDFLFHMPDSKIAGGRKANYDYYLYHYKLNFIEKHPFLEHHTAHECRHTLRTELEKLNVKEIIINSIIGHSNDNVGKDIYTHISIEEKLEAINLITYKEKNKLYILASNQ